MTRDRTRRLDNDAVPNHPDAAGEPISGGGGAVGAGVGVLGLVAMRQLMALMFLAVTSFFLTLSALPSWAVAGGAGIEFAGVVTTAMLVVTVAVQMLVPSWVARFGTGTVLVIGLVLLGVPTPLYLLDQGVWWLSAVSAVRGAGFAVVTVLGVTLTARIAPPGRRGEAIGLFGLAIALPNMVAVPVGVALTLAGHFTWVALGAMSPLLAVPLVRALTRRVARSEPRTHQPAGAAGHERRRGVSREELVGVTVPSVLLLVVTLAGGGLGTFLPIERPDGVLAAVALAVFGIAAALSRWGVGLLADRIGTRLLTPLSLVVSASGIAGVAAGLVGGADWLVLVAAASFGVGYGSIQNLTLLQALARTSSPGLASAAWNACFDSGTALGAFAVGLVAGVLGTAGAYGLCALVIAATIPLALSLRRR